MMTLGLTLNGAIRGIYSTTPSNGGNVRTLIGVEEVRKDKYGVEVTEMHDVDLGKFAPEGTLEKVKSLIGQIVRMPVDVNAWAPKNGDVRINYRLDAYRTIEAAK